VLAPTFERLGKSSLCAFCRHTCHTRSGKDSGHSARNDSCAFPRARPFGSNDTRVDSLNREKLLTHRPSIYIRTLKYFYYIYKKKRKRGHKIYWKGGNLRYWSCTVRGVVNRIGKAGRESAADRNEIRTTRAAGNRRGRPRTTYVATASARSRTKECVAAVTAFRSYTTYTYYVCRLGQMRRLVLHGFFHVASKPIRRESRARRTNSCVDRRVLQIG